METFCVTPPHARCLKKCPTTAQPPNLLPRSKAQKAQKNPKTYNKGTGSKMVWPLSALTKVRFFAVRKPPKSPKPKKWRGWSAGKGIKRILSNDYKGETYFAPKSFWAYFWAFDPRFSLYFCVLGKNRRRVEEIKNPCKSMTYKGLKW
jgi:hypothetical protein